MNMSFKGSLTENLAPIEVFGKRIAKAGNNATMRGLARAMLARLNGK